MVNIQSEKHKTGEIGVRVRGLFFLFCRPPPPQCGGISLVPGAIWTHKANKIFRTVESAIVDQWYGSRPFILAKLFFLDLGTS